MKKIGADDEGGIGIRIPKWRGSDKRIHQMDNVGVDMQILGLSAPNVYFPDLEVSKDLTQMTNEVISGICAKKPRSFSGYGQHSSESKKTIEIIERCGFSKVEKEKFFLKMAWNSFPK